MNIITDRTDLHSETLGVSEFTYRLMIAVSMLAAVAVLLRRCFLRRPDFPLARNVLRCVRGKLRRVLLRRARRHGRGEGTRPFRARIGNMEYEGIGNIGERRND